MPEESDSKWDKWKRIRAQGRNRFIWRQGVLVWGILTGVTWAIVMAATRGWEQIHVLLPIALIAFPIGGFFFGLIVWAISESKYKRHVEQQEDPP